MRLGLGSREHIPSGLATATGLMRIALVMLKVIAQVAPLAHRLQVLRAAVHRLMVQVSHGQHDLAFGPLRRLTISLHTAPRARCSPMQAALSFALAAAS